MWLEDANSAGETKSWSDAISYCNTLEASGHTDWRLPNVKELHSLIHFAFFQPAIPNTIGESQWAADDPFTNVQSEYYWSSTTFPNFAGAGAWGVNIANGYVGYDDKANSHHVWPVRGGN